MKRGYAAQVYLIQKFLDSARGIAYKGLFLDLEAVVNWRMTVFLSLLISGRKLAELVESSQPHLKEDSTQ